MKERFAHLSYMRQSSGLSVTALLVPSLSNTSISDCGCHGNIHTGLSHASDPSCGCHGTTSKDLSHALELACPCRGTTHISYISIFPISPISFISPISTPSIFNLISLEYSQKRIESCLKEVFVKTW